MGGGWGQGGGVRAAQNVPHGSRGGDGGAQYVDPRRAAWAKAEAGAGPREGGEGERLRVALGVL